MSKKRYKKGRRIKSLNDFMRCMTEDGFVISRNKVYHAGWAASWMIRHVDYLINQKCLNKCVKIKEEK